jgi:hypothetical protein
MSSRITEERSFLTARQGVDYPKTERSRLQGMLSSVSEAKQETFER